METEGSLPCSQPQVSFPYPKPDASGSQFPALFPEDPVYYYPTIYS
jgi:hypothetical protein